ncbi:unnamed protein product, partial [Larinioides sclopetarius]
MPPRLEPPTPSFRTSDFIWPRFRAVIKRIYEMLTVNDLDLREAVGYDGQPSTPPRGEAVYLLRKRVSTIF